MYADHHVTEVRRILFELPGIKEVIASSAFRVVEVSFDASKTKEATIRETLDASSYLSEIPMIVETGVAADNRAFPRHSTTVVEAGTALSFAHSVPYAGLAALSCPGMGVIKTEEE
jgi:copper chaperone CopZ